MMDNDSFVWYYEKTYGYRNCFCHSQTKSGWLVSEYGKPLKVITFEYYKDTHMFYINYNMNSKGF